MSEDNTETATAIENSSAMVTDVTSKSAPNVRLSPDALIKEFEATQQKSDGRCTRIS